MLGLSGLAGSAGFAVLGLWVTRGIWLLSVHLWLRCGLISYNYADWLTVITMRSLFVQNDSPESFSPCHRLLAYDECIVIATRWHMRSDCWLVEACKVLLLLLILHNVTKVILQRCLSQDIRPKHNVSHCVRACVVVCVCVCVCVFGLPYGVFAINGRISQIPNFSTLSRFRD